MRRTLLTAPSAAVLPVAADAAFYVGLSPLWTEAGVGVRLLFTARSAVAGVPAAGFVGFSGEIVSCHVSSRRRCRHPKLACHSENRDHFSIAISMAAWAVLGWPSAAAPVSTGSWCRPTLHSLVKATYLARKRSYFF
jgi:hypothetical protein